MKKIIIRADLIDTFEDVRLENFDKFTLQNHLNQLAKTHSKDRVLQIRSYMRAIFAEAVDQDYLPKDPARTVKTPANLREVDKTTLTWEQMREALSKLALRDWILLKLDMSNALRPSELFALKWRCFDPADQTLDIQETVYKGKIRPYGKTKGSLTKVPVAKQLAKELTSWRQQCKDPSPEAFIFPGRRGPFMDSSNFRKRVLHKLAEELELPKLTFQVIRRTIATLGKTKGHVKDIQGMMRHSKASTTTDVYMQSLEDEVRTAINSIHSELTGTGTTGPALQDPMRASPNARLASANSSVTTKNGSPAKERNAASAQGEMSLAKPVKGVVLEFATKMRQSRGREVLLND